MKPNCNSSADAYHLTDFSEHSDELVIYTGLLAEEAVHINPKAACGICWSRLTYYQRQTHDEKHDFAIRTPKSYSDLDKFIQFATEFGRVKIDERGLSTYQKLNAEPHPMFQGRKTMEMFSPTCLMV